jgi:Arm DNA-binding domain
MALTTFAIKAARPKDKPFKLADGGGLHLLVQPNGNKFWRLWFRFGGVEKMLALGSYPATTLAEARAKRDDARKLIESGADPAIQKKHDRLAAEAASRNTFKAIAEDHVANMTANGLAPVTIEKHRWLLLDVAAPLANRPVADITSAELLEVLKRVEKSGRRETAKRLRATMSAVFRLAIVTTRATNDPTRALKGALLRPNVQHHAAITDEKECAAFLRALDEFDGWPVIRAAMKFLTLTCARPGEVRPAHRDEFNFEKVVWRVPAERTKTRR